MYVWSEKDRLLLSCMSTYYIGPDVKKQREKKRNFWAIIIFVFFHVGLVPRAFPEFFEETFWLIAINDWFILCPKEENLKKERKKQDICIQLCEAARSYWYLHMDAAFNGFKAASWFHL